MTVEIVLKQELRIFWPQEPEQSTFSEGPLFAYVRLNLVKSVFPLVFTKTKGSYVKNTSKACFICIFIVLIIQEVSILKT